jgi:soluble lytic murein transglycosylase-like protein
MNDFIKIFMLVGVVLVLVISSALLTVNYAVLPLENKYNELITENKKLTKDYEELSLKKATLIKELEKKFASLEYDILVNYIKTKTSNLTDDMVESTAKAIVNNAYGYNLPCSLIVGMIDRSSSFNTTMVSEGGNRGLMQIMPYWMEKLDISKFSELHIPKVGVDLGLKVFSHYLDKSGGDFNKALYKYSGSTKFSYKFVEEVAVKATEYSMFRNGYIIDYKSEIISEDLENIQVE